MRNLIQGRQTEKHRAQSQQSANISAVLPVPLTNKKAQTNRQRCTDIDGIATVREKPHTQCTHDMTMSRTHPVSAWRSPFGSCEEASLVTRSEELGDTRVSVSVRTSPIANETASFHWFFWANESICAVSVRTLVVTGVQLRPMVWQTCMHLLYKTI